MCLLSRRISNKVKLLTWIINKTGIYFTGRYFPRITVSRTVSSRRVRFAVGWGRRQTNGDDIEIRPLKTKYLHLRGSFSVLSSTETCLSLNCDSQICQPHPSSRSHLSPPIPQTHPRARDAETSRARVGGHGKSAVLICSERHRWRTDERALSFFGLFTLVLQQ